MNEREKLVAPGVFPDCGCHYTTDDDGIHFCPLHAAAEELLAVCKAALPIIDAHRRAALGEGDVVAMLIRNTIARIEKGAV